MDKKVTKINNFNYYCELFTKVHAVCVSTTKKKKKK